MHPPRVTHEINHASPQNLSTTKNNELPTITSHIINIEKQSEHHIIVIVQQHPRTKFIEQHTQINIHRLTHPRTKLRRGRRREGQKADTDPTHHRCLSDRPLPLRLVLFTLKPVATRSSILILLLLLLVPLNPPTSPGSSGPD